MIEEYNAAILISKNHVFIIIIIIAMNSSDLNILMFTFIVLHFCIFVKSLRNVIYSNFANKIPLLLLLLFYTLNNFFVCAFLIFLEKTSFYSLAVCMYFGINSQLMNDA